MEKIGAQRQGMEALKETAIVNYSWKDVRAWEAEGKEYPHRSLVRLLIADSLPPRREPRFIGKIRGTLPERKAIVAGVERRVVPVDAIYRGEYGVVIEDGLDASELLPDIMISKGFGPCVFMAGFKDGKGFLTHNRPGDFDRASFMQLFDRIGIERNDPAAEIYIGAGKRGTSQIGSGRSGTARRTTMRAAEERGLRPVDIGAVANADSPDWETTSVLVDGKNKIIIAISNDAAPALPEH